MPPVVAHPGTKIAFEVSSLDCSWVLPIRKLSWKRGASTRRRAGTWPVGMSGVVQKRPSGKCAPTKPYDGLFTHFLPADPYAGFLFLPAPTPVYHLGIGLDTVIFEHRHITTTQIYAKRRRSTAESASHDVPI